MDRDRIDIQLVCSNDCPFSQECGNQVGKANKECIDRIKNQTGAADVTRSYPKRAELSGEDGTPMGSIRGGYIWTQETTNFQS